MFKDRLSVEAMPKRVFVLAKTVNSKKGLSKEELRDLLSPEEKGKSAFNETYNAALELGLIEENDEGIVSRIDSSLLKSPTALRPYIIRKLNTLDDSMFFKLSRFMFKESERSNALPYNLTDAKSFVTELTDDVKNIRAWRFWAQYIGLGIVLGNPLSFYPNPSEYLKECIKIAGLEKGMTLTMDEFFDKLSPSIRLIEGFDTGRQIGYGLSAGLYTLHKEGVIKLKHVRDNDGIWFFSNMNKKIDLSSFTDVEILR